MGSVVSPDTSGTLATAVTTAREIETRTAEHRLVNPQSGPLVAIGALSRQTRCNIETIRFYEKIGILEKPVRSAGGHRMYGPAHVGRLSFVRRARELGFTLDQVRALLRLSDKPDCPCAEAKSLAQMHLDEVRSKIDDLLAMQRALADLVGQCETGDGTDCALLEALSHHRSR